MKKLQSNKGFTLVELIIVIAILAIIMLIAIPNFSGIQQRMQVRADKATAAQIGKAVRVWFTDYTTDKTMARPSVHTLAVATGEAGAYTASGTYYPSDVETYKESNKAGLKPTRYESLKGIEGYISLNQLPSSLRKNNQTVVDQAYGVFLTASAESTASKIAVAIYSSATEEDAGYTTITNINDGVTASYNGTAAGVAYVEP